MTAVIPEELKTSPARRMWEHFFALSAIPRPPGGEEKVRAHLRALALDNGWEAAEDGAGNLVCRVPGRGCLEAAEPLILQGHMDMVCEKEPDSEHDFTRDALRLRIADGWVQGTGTTLGADNGIGVALALAVAEADLPNRLPLELLFTVEEETGLTGAMKLDGSLLRGRSLINLDSEEEGVIIVGCAGGKEVRIRFRREGLAVTSRSPAFRCRLGGLRGGHSGINIHEDRANAIVLAAGLLERLRKAGRGAMAFSIDGGTKINAIPRDAEFVFNGVQRKEAETVVDEALYRLRRVEPQAVLSLGEEAAPREPPLPWALVELLGEIPNGVIAMDTEIEGLVHTSANIGVLESDASGATLRVKVRSSDNTRRDEECERIAASARRRGGEAVTEGAYPGWAPNTASDLVRRLERSCREVSGRPPRVQGIHAGLEAGVIGEMIGSGDLVSIGPNIENAHSPGERLQIGSAENVLLLLERFVSSLDCHLPRETRRPSR